jgi:hypothetical protein
MDLISSERSQSQSDNLYLGYSMAVIKIRQQQSEEYVLVGKPRGNNLTGEVVLLHGRLLKDVRTFMGEQGRNETECQRI